MFAGDALIQRVRGTITANIPASNQAHNQLDVAAHNQFDIAAHRSLFREHGAPF
jgi:hypothetical protein